MKIQECWYLDGQAAGQESRVRLYSDDEKARRWTEARDASGRPKGGGVSSERLMTTILVA